MEGMGSDVHHSPYTCNIYCLYCLHRKETTTLMSRELRLQCVRGPAEQEIVCSLAHLGKGFDGIQRLRGTQRHRGKSGRKDRLLHQAGKIEGSDKTNNRREKCKRGQEEKGRQQRTVLIKSLFIYMLYVSTGMQDLRRTISPNNLTICINSMPVSAKVKCHVLIQYNI